MPKNQRDILTKKQKQLYDSEEDDGSVQTIPKRSSRLAIKGPVGKNLTFLIKETVK